MASAGDGYGAFEGEWLIGKGSFDGSERIFIPYELRPHRRQFKWRRRRQMNHPVPVRRPKWVSVLKSIE